jgi:SAM-dependent methyltransferase
VNLLESRALDGYLRAVSDADRIFLETTRRFAPPRLARDDVRTALLLAQVGPDKPVADLGCGYGRHLAALEEEGHFGVLGIDLSGLLLAQAARTAPHARLVRADLKALPFPEGSLSAAFCFYSSMFLGTHEDTLQALRETARVLRRGGSLVLTQDNPLRLARRPHARFEDDVPGLGKVVEESRFDAAQAVDRVTKSLVTPAGEHLSATFVIRYYPPPSLSQVARAAGLSLRRLEPDAEVTEATPQLVALLEKAP